MNTTEKCVCDNFLIEDGWCWKCIQKDPIHQDLLNEMIHSDLPFINCDDRLKILSLLLEKGADPNSIDDSYDRRLYLITKFCRQGNIEELKILLDHPNIDANVKEYGGWSLKRFFALEVCLMSYFCLSFNVIKKSVKLMIQSGKVTLEHRNSALNLMENGLYDPAYTEEEKNKIISILESWDFYTNPVKEMGF